MTFFLWALGFAMSVLGGYWWATGAGNPLRTGLGVFVAVLGACLALAMAVRIDG